MKIFPVSKIAEIDNYTILNEPISDIDLMERAAGRIADYIIQKTVFQGELMVFCGPGNNGGDGLAVARLLAELDSRFSVTVFILDTGKPLSGSSAINLRRLNDQTKSSVYFIRGDEDINIENSCVLIIDALYGSGLNRPLDYCTSLLIQKINESDAYVISIDIPSGLMGEDNSDNIPDNIVKADKTLTFQFPKLSFLFSENEKYTGEWEILDIGLHEDAVTNIETPFYLTEMNNIKPLFKTRNKFSHKGNYGHAHIISGAFGKMGAAILSSKACLRCGIGLLTTHIPSKGVSVLQVAVPEAMTSIDESAYIFTGAKDIFRYNAIGIGPAIGTDTDTQKAFISLVKETKIPLVIDADAINIISLNKDLLPLLPEGSILTPHPKEFERLAGFSENSYVRLSKALMMAEKYKIFIILKGAYTSVVCPDGNIFFNSTGNPGMATAGSGDVLTGIITALMAQGYSSKDSAVAGVFLHGLAGDIAIKKTSMISLIASDIIESLGEVFKIFEI
ncbi:MAG: NAD(P)H-hydrate dehydratase [Prolixibacteraceae bacterium]|nr:NAD(P)H-hydrate dehydratase [Prolixibacteraceae bacterium]